MFQNITLGICTVKTLFYRCYQFGEASKFEEYNRITAAGCLLKMLKMVQFLHRALISQAFSRLFPVSPGTWILWQKHLVLPKFPNYHPMQNAWSMDFISGFFTHVNQLEFMLLASLPVGWWGWGGGDNEGGCPSTTSRRSSGPNAGRQGCQWRPCQGGSTVFVITQKVTDIDCVQSDIE